MNFILEILHVGWRSKLALKQHKHFHPSGNTEPSREDRLMTKRLHHAGQIMDIELLDHIIVGGGSGAFFSFRENGVFEELTMGTGDRDFGQER